MSIWIAAAVAHPACFGADNSGPGKVSFTREERSHWAFQKVTRPKSPTVRSARWIRNPIDAFILAALEGKGLEPAPVADKLTLLRRVTLDLTGLPPTPGEAEAFVADASPQAFERVVDRLLASPHYGERWARHWLDLARYAESEGFKADETRPHAWRYRDYVIQSFNADKPYDRFLREQIAGDELWPDDPGARVATGFNRHYPDESNARNLMQRRQEILNDITDTTASVFLGLTVACARCHDHKFDPIRQTDYYRLQAFFANVGADDNIPLVPRDERDQHAQKLAAWEEQTRAVRAEIAAIEEPHRQAIINDYVDKYPEEIQAALARPESERTMLEWQMVHKARQYIDPASHQYIATSRTIEARIKGEQKKRYEELQDALDRFKDLHPGELPAGAGMIDVAPEPPSTYLLRRGVYDAPNEEVVAGNLQILDPRPAVITRPKQILSSGRRSALAEILADPRNPLTARVMVNRLWHHHFGRGIVGTPSDFGVKGDRPTHPALLDWLASEFMGSGWSLKRMHKLMVTSATYQQTSRFDAKAARLDPDNQLLWRFPRQRLEGEVIRDAALAVSGLLDPTMGGPSIRPELPPGMNPTYSGWKVSSTEAERNRRSIYVFVKRNTRYPLFESFDMPDTHESCSRRAVTITPTQALNLLNSELTLAWAQHLAGRVVQQAGCDTRCQIDTAFRLAYSRPPSAAELEMAASFFARHQPIVAERAAREEPLALPPSLPPEADSAQAATLVDLCHMLINANEFVYRN